jgi:SAM-dependent methyltransferase
MGIAKGAAILLMKESLRRSFKGNLLTLGKQGLTFSPYVLHRYAKLAHFPIQIPNNLDRFSTMKDRDFFSLLGFSQIDALDYSDYEEAQLRFDLNSGDTPDQYRETFDAIYDGGTIEHVFHLPNALKSLIWMLKPGGRLIHFSPASNYMEHGFYMFSPTFFYDFYKCNDFEINSIQIVQIPACSDSVYKTYNYQPGSLDRDAFGFGGLDNQMYSLHVIVTKTSQSTSHQIPNQGAYANGAWVKPKVPQKMSFLNRKLYSKWKERFKLSPLYPLYALFKRAVRRYRLPLELRDKF